MAAGAHSVGRRIGTDREEHAHERKLTPAQLFAYLAGAVLTLVGLLGFIADSTFDTGGSVQGRSLLGFGVNGWHNVIHLLSGLVLLAAARKRRSAKTVVLAFGVVYALVTLIGLIDGNDIFGLLPVNPADNILHALLTLAAIGAALASRADDDHVPATAGGDSLASTGRRVDSSHLIRDTDHGSVDRPGTPAGRGSEHVERELEPRDLNPHEHGTGTPERRTL